MNTPILRFVLISGMATSVVSADFTTLSVHVDNFYGYGTSTLPTFDDSFTTSATYSSTNPVQSVLSEGTGSFWSAAAYGDNQARLANSARATGGLTYLPGLKAAGINEPETIEYAAADQYVESRTTLTVTLRNDGPPVSPFAFFHVGPTVLEAVQMPSVFLGSSTARSVAEFEIFIGPSETSVMRRVQAQRMLNSNPGQPTEFIFGAAGSVPEFFNEEITSAPLPGTLSARRATYGEFTFPVSLGFIDANEEVVIRYVEKASVQTRDLGGSFPVMEIGRPSDPSLIANFFELDRGVGFVSTSDPFTLDGSGSMRFIEIRNVPEPQTPLWLVVAVPLLWRRRKR